MKSNGIDLNKSSNNYMLYNFQKLALIKNVHSNYIICVCFLKDGRIVSSSNDKRILIFNKITYKNDIKIKEKESINYININKDGILIVCLQGGTLFNLYEFKGKKYKKIQSIKSFSFFESIKRKFKNSYYYYSVKKFIELKNGNLAAILKGSNLIYFYKKENDKKYSYLDKFFDNSKQIISDICELNNKEYCIAAEIDEVIRFVDINIDTNSQSITGTIKISRIAFSNTQLFLMNINDLFVLGNECIYLIDIKKKSLIKNIKIKSGIICCGYKLSDNNILIGSLGNCIEQLKYDEKNKELITISIMKPKKTNELYQINSISVFNNKLILSPYDNAIGKGSLAIHKFKNK